MTCNLKCVGGVWATCTLMGSVLKESALLWGAGKKYITFFILHIT